MSDDANDAVMFIRLPSAMKAEINVRAGNGSAAQYVREAIASRLALDELPPTLRNAGDGKDGGT